MVVTKTILIFAIELKITIKNKEIMVELIITIKKGKVVARKVFVQEERTECQNSEKELHCEDGPAAECTDGSEKWYNNGKSHRPDESEKWYNNGKSHRPDGPAVEHADSKEWWIDGEKLTKEEFIIRTQPKREMTMEQLEKELGFAVKIVK